MNLRELFLKENPVQNRYKILTESGYSTFDNVVSTGVKNTLKFTLETEFIEVSDEHIFFKDQKEIIANTLNVGDTLQTKTGLQKILSIETGETEVFDVLETEDHTYFANNVLNHNCEFLGSSHTLIKAEVLGEMKAAEIEEIRDGKLNIYHYPQKDHKYIMTVDASKDGKDAFAVQIIDITDFEFVQSAAAQLQIDYLLMPEFINEWCELYNKPYLVIENNEGAGQSIADQMYNDYEYENLHFDKDVGRNKKKKYPGFRTTTKTRKQILQTLKLFIDNRKLEVNDKSTIGEFYRFILINNKYQADAGAHDDMIMSLALTFVPFVNSKNFEDMRVVIKALYTDDDTKSGVSFTDMLTIGEFQDGSDESMGFTPSEQFSHNVYVPQHGAEEYEGFV
jgi:hypothetical protein